MKAQSTKDRDSDYNDSQHLCRHNRTKNRPWDSCRCATDSSWSVLQFTTNTTAMSTSPQHVMWHTIHSYSRYVKHNSQLFTLCETQFTAIHAMWNTIHSYSRYVTHNSQLFTLCETQFTAIHIMWHTIHSYSRYVTHNSQLFTLCDTKFTAIHAMWHTIHSYSLSSGHTDDKIEFNTVDFVALALYTLAATSTASAATSTVSATVDFVADLLPVSTFNKVDRVEFNFVASVYQALCPLFRGLASRNTSLQLITMTNKDSSKETVERESNSSHTAAGTHSYNSSSRMRVIYHNWSATKQRPHPPQLQW